MIQKKERRYGCRQDDLGSVDHIKFMKKLLVVVDMQNDFIDGSLGTKEAEAIVPAVKRKVEAYMADGDDVVFTMDTHCDNYMETLEGKHLPVKHCIKGTKGWEICPALSTFEGRRFEKTTFGSVDLAAYVEDKEYDAIELAGLCTDICVISNALILKAVLPGTPILVDSACCAGVTPESHRNALKAMEMCQVEVN